jgi:cell division protein ZapA
MNANARQVTVQILDKEYRVACQPEEEKDLFEAARFLNHKMQEIRDRGRVIGIDRIAVMAALNLAHDLLQCQAGNVQGTESVNAKIRYLRGKIENAINKSRQMEL